MTFERAKSWIAIYTRFLINGKPYSPFNIPPEQVIAVPTDAEKLLSFNEYYNKLGFDWENAIKPYRSCNMQVLFQFQKIGTNQKQYISSGEFIRLNRIHINITPPVCEFEEEGPFI